MTLRILFVEDHDDTRNLLSRFLRRFGYEVDSVGTYESALKALNRSQFQVLLSDLTLPDGDGCDLVLEAKRRQNLKAVALTARASDGDLERGAAVGFDHYLTKPFDMHELRSVLGQALH
jgi:DNA-binding response OmpR family regulator